MITYQRYDIMDAVNDRFYAVVDCLSTDVKPTAHIYNGSVLHELDTGKTYRFDQQSEQWYQVKGGGGGATVGTLTLSTSWTGDGPYAQIVAIPDGTENSKIDLQPTQEVYAQMMTDGCTALWCVNDNGTFTVYAMGQPLTQSVTVQYTRAEVEA